MPPSDIPTGFPFDADISVQKDVSYLGIARREKVDIYHPAASFARPLPAVLLIHGGGWRIGDKASRREVHIAENLAAHGYAVFAINYLLNEGCKDDNGIVHTTKVAWPQNLHDCKSGLRFLRKEAVRFGIDPSRIAVMGESAGGSMTMLLGCTIDAEEFNGGGLYTDHSNDFACMINMYGVYDVQDHRRVIFAGATEEETAENARLASPSTWLHPKMPPVLVIHGSADTGVPVDASRTLVSRLQEMGADYWYVEIAGAPHSFHLQPEQMDLRPIVLQFLARHMPETSACLPARQTTIPPLSADCPASPTFTSKKGSAVAS